MRDKRVGLEDIYLKGYPYKRNYPFKKGTVPQPYIKKEDVSLHPFASDFHVFRNVVNGYLEYIMEHMQQGNAWRLNFNLGEMRIKKFQHTFLKDSMAMKGKVAPKNEYKRIQTPDDYFLAPRWHRKSIHVKLKYNWIVHIPKPRLKECYRRVENDYSYIYKFQDT